MGTEQLNKSTADLDMTFRSFVELYTADMQTRLKENTWPPRITYPNQLLPYFGKPQNVQHHRPADYHLAK